MRGRPTIASMRRANKALSTRNVSLLAALAAEKKLGEERVRKDKQARKTAAVKAALELTPEQVAELLAAA